MKLSPRLVTSSLKHRILLNCRLKKKWTPTAALVTIAVITVVLFTIITKQYTNPTVDYIPEDYSNDQLISNKSFEALTIDVKPLAEGLLTFRQQIRPWYLTNGSMMLAPELASHLPIWPEESADPSDDRVVNQLMFVPLGYDRRKAVIKTIYLSSSDEDWKLPPGRKEFLDCPVSSCRFVGRHMARKADLIFFKARTGLDEFIAGRPAQQIWAKFEIESPLNVKLTAPNGTINWTVSYRHDSEIPTPYYKFYPYDNEPNRRYEINYAFNKTKKVAWFVSNCIADNYRLEYAKELAKLISVDIYGRCGSMSCPKSRFDECSDMLNKDYKFYLSFENSNCIDYITEKFWFHGLMHNVIPIVMGAHPSTYARVAPPHSYIHVDDFPTPEALADYLKLLDNNDTLYNEYFEWKGTGEVREIFMWCRVCALLHAPERHNTYTYLQDWWRNNNTCAHMSWTNMKVNISTEQNDHVWMFG